MCVHDKIVVTTVISHYIYVSIYFAYDVVFMYGCRNAFVHVYVVCVCNTFLRHVQTPPTQFLTLPAVDWQMYYILYCYNLLQPVSSLDVWRKKWTD